jgi:hypothetical protein
LDGDSQPRSSRVTRGMTTQVMTGTVISVVIASRGTTGRLPISGAVAITMTVISGKMVTHVSTAIL